MEKEKSLEELLVEVKDIAKKVININEDEIRRKCFREFILIEFYTFTAITVVIVFGSIILEHIK